MSFYAVFDRIVPAGSKCMGMIFNTSATRKVVINRIYVFNWQVAAATGIILEQSLVRISSRTPLSSVTIVPEDSNDSISAGITADTATTFANSSTPYSRFFASSEEVILATDADASLTGTLAFHDTGQLIYWRKPDSKGIVLRQNQGFGVRNVTASTAGTVSYRFEFDDEPA